MTDVTYEEVLRDPYRLEPLIAQLDPSIPLQAAKINHARHFSRIGMRYSNEDLDIRMSLRSAIGKTEVAPYEASFVAYWTNPANL